MNTSRKFVQVMAAGLIFLSAACSGNDATDPVGSADVTTVTVRPAVVRGALNGFEGPFDSIALIADVYDDRNNLMIDRTVTWTLQLSSGAQAGDSIATIISTGTQTANLVFHGEGLVGVVAAVRGNDGVTRTGTLYVTQEP